MLKLRLYSDAITTKSAWFSMDLLFQRAFATEAGPESFSPVKVFLCASNHGSCMYQLSTQLHAQFFVLLWASAF